MASLFNLIEDLCKSIWNSSMKADLFSSTIFLCVVFCYLFGLFWIISVSPDLHCSEMATAEDPPSKKRKKDTEPPQKVKITYPSDDQHWGRKLPPEHG